MKTTGTRPKITVSADGRGVVGHAGARLLADIADTTGLTSQFSDALAGLRQRQGGHDPGRVAVDVAVMLADGGHAIADLAVLRDQADLFGAVASDPTAWRVLSGMDSDTLDRLRTARAAARELAWAQTAETRDGIPTSTAAGRAVPGLVPDPVPGGPPPPGHARVEDRIRCGKDTGFGHFPSREFAINAAWLQLALTAIDLLAWTQHLLLDGDLAHAEPKKLRYRLLHVAARITRTARRTRLRIAQTWPWKDTLVTAFDRLAALPQLIT